MTTEQRKDSNYLWASELFKTLVFEYRIVSLDYFLHDMGISEAYLAMEHIKWTDVNYKIIMRYGIWSLYNSNAWGKNKNKIEDIMELPWDEKQQPKVATEQQLKDMQSVAKDLENILEEGKFTTEKYM